MITGYNTDVEYNGRIYHVQTEDKGTANPVIESLIYVGGEILAARRTPYGELLRSGLEGKALSEKVESQHRRMILDVRQGRYDPAGVKPFGAGIISDRGFEEVVLDYLASELSSESLQVVLESTDDFVEGTTVELAIRARGELSGLPIGNVKVGVRLITTLEKPSTLAEGRTDRRGFLKLGLAVPLVEGNAALILQAAAGEESVELKWLVKKPSRRP